MAKTGAGYECQECGAASPQWLGRCPACAAWDAIVPTVNVSPRRSRPGERRVAAAVPLREVPDAAVTPLGTGVGELDRVLGGGLVPASVTLLGGEPGVGKSTLLLQAVAGLAAAGRRCLLVTGEESPPQVRRRAGRLGAAVDGVYLLAETWLPNIHAAVDDLDPHVLVVDSIQTLTNPDLPGAAGSLAQVRECAQSLVTLAKTHGVAVVLVGHVTKDGDLAGPRALEHVVDTVVSLEGDRHHGLRLLRTPKHRFGSTSELGVLEMTSAGLSPVADPSRVFLADRRPGTPGSVVAAVVEGNRPLLVEVQALVTDAVAAIPRRSAQGVESGRLNMLTAVLGRRAAVPVGRSDVYVSVAGGLRVAEPGVDLAVALALTGACRGLVVSPTTVAVGEVGLGGEVRQVAHLERRLAEAARMGFTRALAPPTCPPVAGLTVVHVGTVSAAVAAADAA
ncbi:MAG TPA: DNA repair protein RadA [Acidimicrobiia bacterium]|nr:DNA repair protein RadA [Acidimicrobiia bacterium]